MTIERAARAMRDHIESGQITNVPNFDAAHAAFYHDLALICLDAIADPTPEMIRAGKEYFGNDYADEFLRKTWLAMHAVMMKETK